MLCLSVLNITQTRPCNIHKYFTAVNVNVNFQVKNQIFFSLFFQTLIEGTY